ncbi:MAG: ATP-binding cassette domain-containing protein [Chitinophagaceae bacterium]|nr:MAG: ATP-binding cassette domain-containing protein [Chitinophagaceae bacterium]
MLELKNVYKTFDDGSGMTFNALEDINLHFKKGTFTTIIGGNGSGKSTLLNVIAGNLSCEKGEILLKNKKINHLSDYKRAAFISRIFQDPLSGTAPGLTIIENMRLAALRNKSKGLKLGINSSFKSIIKEKISQLGLGLENNLNQPVSNLSGGQRQALTLVMATIELPEVILLDEPTAALDPKAAGLIMKIAAEIIQKEQLTAILVTHNMQEAIQYGDRLLHIHHGKIKRDLDAQEKSTLKPLELISWFQEI